MKTRRYAEGTAVSVEKTRGELDALLAKHGAHQRQTAVDDETGRAQVTFKIVDRMVRLELRVTELLPDPEKADHQQKAKCPSTWWRMGPKERKDWIAKQRDQYQREAWRRLLLVVKAKLEFIADEMSTVEREFLPDIVLPNGATVGSVMGPQIAQSYLTGNMPPLLSAGSED